MSKLVSILSIGLLLSPAAFAGYYCADPKLVAGKTHGDCSDNEYVSEAAVLCLEKLEAEIDAAQKAVSAAAAAHAQADAGTQQSKEQNAGADYHFSEATLALLIAHAEKAQAEIVQYDKKVLAMPEDFDEPEITGMDTETYLKSTPCFADNRKVLQNVLLDFDKHISDLQFAKDNSEKLRGGTQTNAAGLGTVSEQKRAKGTHGSGGPKPAVDSGKEKVRGSDITGTRPKK